ncbi:MAG TPA: hypothetical protein PKZ28_06825, partial [Piscinibacter sp.]|nr:hypothetical protein [Piscinibacter sp.]
MSDAGFIDTFTVAIEGFSAFERQALASFFRLAARRSPAFRQVDEPGMADFLIADADHAASVAAVRRGQRVEDTVFIGARDGKYEEALHKIQRSLSLNANQPEAYRLRDRISGERERSGGECVVGCCT